MRTNVSGAVSGHVYKVERETGPVWYAKYRPGDGTQVKKKIGPAWTHRGRPADGYFTKTTAKAWLDDELAKARSGESPRLNRTGVPFREANAEYLRYAANERAVKPSTLSGYENMGRVLVGEFGDEPIENFSDEFFERWKGSFQRRRNLSNRTMQKYLRFLGAIFKRAMKVYGLRWNPMETVELPRLQRSAGIDVLDPDEIASLVAAAENRQDGTLYLVGAFTGLRLGELRGLRWGDVDFDGETIRVRRNWTHGQEGTPKSGRDRAVPMFAEVADALAALRQRERLTGDHDLVFCDGIGRHLGYKSLKRRYKDSLERASLRPLRFHDLRHTFGTRAIRVADPREVMEWMGHADIQTTQKYLAYKPRAGAASRLRRAFVSDDPTPAAKKRVAPIVPIALPAGSADERVPVAA